MWLKRALAVWLIVGFLGLLLPVGTAGATTTPEVAAPFRDYYNQHQGMRVLGYPLTQQVKVNNYQAQYFEKGRLEDHQREVSDPNWKFMYGRLSAELMERNWQGSVNATALTYAQLKSAADPRFRQLPPPGFFSSGTMVVRDDVFIPYNPQLKAAPGYLVPIYFWVYMNRAELFPGGWLHDIGLPITQVFMVETDKFGLHRTIAMQAFERSVLTFDPLNPAEWQVERGNIGSDLIRSQSMDYTLILPQEGARLTLPLHLFARGGQPGQLVTAIVRWQDGTQLAQTFPLLAGEDGRGLLIGNMNWSVGYPPPQPPTQGASLQIRDQWGNLLDQQWIILLSADDPATQPVQVYWVLGEEVRAISLHIPKTERIGSATVEELLWGPAPPNLAGFITALPAPEQVLSYPGRTADWGPRVTLRSLSIENGVATADFSKEMRAYGGGSLRIKLIREQITRTLMQFPSVQSVKIAIEGQTEGVLEP